MIAPAGRIMAADALMDDRNLSNYTGDQQRQEKATALAVVAIAQLLEAQNFVLDRIADILQARQ